MITNIKSAIENEIDIVKQNRSKLYRELIKSNSRLDEIIHKIDLIIDSPDKIDILTEEDCFELEKFYDKSNIQNLKAYKIVLSNPNFGWNAEYLLKAKNIVSDIKEKYGIYNKSRVIANKEFDLLTKRLEQLNALLTRINQDFNLDPNDIDLLIEIYKSAGKNSDEIIDTIVYIANTCIKEFNLTKVVVEHKESLVDSSEDDIEQLEETNLTEEQLIDLFRKYGYDFKTFDKSSIDLLKKYGNIENIDSMLSILVTYDVDIKFTILSYSKFLTEVFIYSNPKLFEDTLLLAQNKGLSLNKDFYQLIKIPGIFIDKKRDILRLYKNGGSSSESSSLYGSHEDFENNINLLEKIFCKVYPNQSFSAIFKKCCFIFSKPHRMIEFAIKTYEFYGIPPENYLKTLTCLNSYNQADILDLALEIGCFEYIENNLSRAILSPDNKLFFMIAKAKQLGYNEDQIFKNDRLKMQTLSADKNININESNGAIETNKYVVSGVRGQIFQEYEKILLNFMKTNGIDCYFLQRFLEEKEPQNKIKEFDNSFVDPENQFLYNINGVVISRYKFLRIYNALTKKNIDVTEDLLLFALTRNSIITQEQFDTIEEEVNKFYQNKELKKC